jgi:hypothetical protein
LLGQAGLRIGIPKAGKIHSASSQPLLPDIPYSRERMPDKYEITEFIFDLKISEPTRRIQGKNHYLFWDPEPRSCLRHGLPLKFLISLSILEIQRKNVSTN